MGLCQFDLKFRLGQEEKRRSRVIVDVGLAGSYQRKLRAAKGILH